MKPNAVSGLTFHVDDLARTTAFYETLGFRRGKEEQDRITFYVNWFFVTFVAQDRADDIEPRHPEAAAKGSGVYLYVKVDDIDDFHKEVVAGGMTPAGEPEKRASGNREFLLRDPDGYRLVFFQKK